MFTRTLILKLLALTALTALAACGGGSGSGNQGSGANQYVPNSQQSPTPPKPVLKTRSISMAAVKPSWPIKATNTPSASAPRGAGSVSQEYQPPTCQPQAQPPTPDANISGNGYSGGIMTVSPTFATDPVTSGALKHEGRFFETDAKEIGGVFILDRTDAGVNFKAEGAYSGNDGS